MELIDRLVSWVDGVKETLFGCRHPNPEPHVQLYPELEYVRYYWECPDCGKEWDE